MGQQQKRISHDSMRCLLLLLLYFEFTIRQYIMLLVHKHSFTLYVHGLLCVCSRHGIGIDEDVRLENWQRSTKQQCNTHSTQATHKRASTRESGWARSQMRPSTLIHTSANARLSASAGARSHSPSLVCPPACLRASSLTRRPSACSHTTLILLCTPCTLYIERYTHVLVHCKQKSQNQRYCVENDNVANTKRAQHI